MDKTLKSLSDYANRHNSLTNVNKVLHNGENFTGEFNISVINYLRLAYIDLLISKKMAPEELKTLFQRYLDIVNSYGEESMKSFNGLDYSKTKLNCLYGMVNVMEFYLKKYGVLSLSINYDEIINNNVSNYEATFEDGECLKKILKNDKLSEE